MNLIYLERKGILHNEKTKGEVHVDEIDRDRNLLFSTTDLQLAKDIVFAYNKFKSEQKGHIVELMNNELL